MSRAWMLLFVAGCATAAARPTKPWGGKPAVIPGVVEAEHYDEGPAGVAYLDQEPKNQGADYRGATEVDIEARPDASGNHGIGWTRRGEWLVYTVEVRESGTYAIEIPVASNKQGGTFHLEFDGVDRTGPISVPDTGGWKILKTIRHENVKLQTGLRTMRLVMDAEGPSKSIADIDLLRFIRSGP